MSEDERHGLVRLAVPKTLLALCIVFGVAALMVPDGALRDGLGAMQLVFLFSAGYVYWKSLKRG
jgi:hypothetical protein